MFKGEIKHMILNDMTHNPSSDINDYILEVSADVFQKIISSFRYSMIVHKIEEKKRFYMTGIKTEINDSLPTNTYVLKKELLRGKYEEE